MPLKKNLSRGSLSNWCDADADEDAYANSSKKYVDPHPTGGRHNSITSVKLAAYSHSAADSPKKVQKHLQKHF